MMWNASLNESQAGINTAGRNVNSIRYVDNITLMAENKEEPKCLLMKEKEETEKADLKFNIWNPKINNKNHCLTHFVSAYANKLQHAVPVQQGYIKLHWTMGNIAHP